MMKTSLQVILVAILVLGCSGNKQTANTKLRLVNAMPDTEEIHIEIKGKEDQKLSLSFATASDYLSLPSGRYEVAVYNGEKKLLSRTFGLAPDDHFTLVVQGLAQPSTEVNQSTSGARWHRIFGGEEASHKNSFLPRFAMIRDALTAPDGKAKIHVVNAYPGSAALTLKTMEKDKKLASGLAYPKSSSKTTLKPGHYQLEAKLSAMPAPLIKHSLEVEPCRIYLVVLTGGPEDRELKMLTLENEAVACKTK